jgi:hypothetical protein
MDSHTRHDLQNNELAKLATSATPFFERYGNHIAVGICVVSIISAGFIYWTRSSYVKAAGAWMSLTSATTPNDLADVADRYKGTSAAGWAKLKEGDRRLADGIQLMFTDREASLVELKKAKEAYAAIVSISDPTIRERALYGHARTLESLSTGDLADAIKAYDTLLKEFPTSVYKTDVEPHLKRLKTGGAQEFYAWFAQQNPKPAPPKKPSDKVGGDDLLGPALPIPELTAPTTPGEKPAAPVDPAKPADEKPAETKPAEAKPTDEKPAEAKPSEEKPTVTKPAEDKPAEEKPAEEKPAEPAKEAPKEDTPKDESPKEAPAEEKKPE